MKAIITGVELKPCPFCGGKAEIKEGNSYWVPCVYTHCTECGTTLRKVPVEHTIYTQGKQIRLTKEQAMQKTANEWNRRADNEQREP